MPLISFILPIYNESENLPKLWEELEVLEIEIKKIEVLRIEVLSIKVNEFTNKENNPNQAKIEKNEANLLQNLEKNPVYSLTKAEENLNNSKIENVINSENRFEKSEKVGTEKNKNLENDLNNNNLKNSNYFECEFVFINDGSADNSWQVLKEIYQKNSHKVKLINFSRNYGHQIAVSCGQNETNADAVIIMDTDLQDPPLVCLELIQKWQTGFDVVYAQRRKYKTNFVKEISAFVFTA